MGQPTPTLRERLEAPETADTLVRDVTAILANPALVRALSVRMNTFDARAPSRSQVQQAWTSISTEDRHIYRVGHGLDGHGSPQRNHFGPAINRTPPNGAIRLEKIRNALFDFIWRQGGFYGLTGRARMLLNKAGVFTPTELLNNLFVLSRDGWGPKLYSELNQWMIGHGLHSLDDKLTHSQRRKFKVSVL